MPSSSRSPPTLLITATLLVLGFCFLVTPCSAFGAGNIPSYSYLEDKAFRHGDIEDVLSTLPKVASSSGAIGAVLGGLFGSASSSLGGGKKFSPLDVKRVYFGNFLRDYSQAVDIATLKKVPLQTILNIVMVLGFMSFGYATGEFEITPDRLGCYLPTEHIDNPKGYGEGEDPRQYDPRLRGPVDDRELEIDQQTGMKSYIAQEGRGWDTSKSLVRRILESCIHFGRQSRANGGSKTEIYEAYRLLGQALHTLEDFTAHSNWCEIALWRLGHKQVFAHVGQNVRIRAPSNGESVPPIVTGTFGGSDFIHSLLGEATDHLSEASVSDLTKSIETAKRDSSAGSSSVLTALLRDLPGGSDDGKISREMNDVTSLRAGQQGGVNPDNMSPQELHETLWKILEFRDSVMKKIENTIDRIPGLGPLVEKITHSLNVFVLTTLEPYMKPIITAATSGLSQGSAEVVNNADQYIVWNDANASDPTHSFLSKDHFQLILNEPAGQVAQVVVEHTVKLVVQAWDDSSMNTRDVTEPILEAMFHPYWYNGRSQIQGAMLDRFKKWFDAESNQREVVNRLTADAVRNHKNTRLSDTSANHGHLQSAFGDQGLQGTLASHNVHVPGAGILNAGQDLASGKMPWQPGFGSGGPNAWRDMDQSSGPNQHGPGYSGGTTQPVTTHSQSQGQYNQTSGQAEGYQQSFSQGQGAGSGYPHSQPQVTHSNNNYQSGYNNAQQGSYGGYQQPPQQQQSYSGDQGGYQQGGHQQGGHQHGGHHQGGWQQGPPPPPPGQYGGPPPPPPGQYGGYQQGPPPPPNQYGGYQQGGYGGPPPPPHQGGGHGYDHNNQQQRW